MVYDQAFRLLLPDHRLIVPLFLSFSLSATSHPPNSPSAPRPADHSLNFESLASDSRHLDSHAHYLVAAVAHTAVSLPSGAGSLCRSVLRHWIALTLVIRNSLTWKRALAEKWCGEEAEVREGEMSDVVKFLVGVTLWCVVVS